MAVSPSPIDLTTVAIVKAWLGDSSVQQNDTLQRAVTGVSRFILSWLSRGMLPADYSERYDGLGYGNSRIVLKNWPVISIASVFVGSTVIAAAPQPGPGVNYGPGYLLSPGEAYPPGAQQWLDFQGYDLPRGSQNIGVTYRAGYQTSESWTIPGSPYAVTLTQVLGYWTVDGGVTINGVVATKVTSTPSTGQYSVSTEGVYTFAAADAGKAAVITYGYIPQDVAQAAIEMIAFRFRSREFIGLNSKSLGGQESISYSQKDMTAPIATMLQSYRRVF